MRYDGEKNEMSACGTDVKGATCTRKGDVGSCSRTTKEHKSKLPGQHHHVCVGKEQGAWGGELG